jgi:hypothetical protein
VVRTRRTEGGVWKLELGVEGGKDEEDRGRSMEVGTGRLGVGRW